MATRTATENSKVDASNDVQTQHNRWRSNGNGQLVDTEAGWDLSDEMVRLRIGLAGDDDQGPIRTPPQSKLASAAIQQLSEASPRESVSSGSADSPPPAHDPQINITHSRGNSTDSTASSAAASRELLAPSNLASFKFGSNGEMKERPHSFSGGLSTADLRRLQVAGDEPGDGNDTSGGQASARQPWSPGHYREASGGQFSSEQLIYPSLAQHSPTNSRSQQSQSRYDYSGMGLTSEPVPADDLDEYGQQERGFNPLSPMARNAQASFIPQAANAPYPR